MPTVPAAERMIKSHRLLGLKLKPFSERINIIPANNNAIRLRKKLFCIEGKSPERRTKVFIRAKKNAAVSIQRMPFCLLVI